MQFNEVKLMHAVTLMSRDSYLFIICFVLNSLHIVKTYLYNVSTLLYVVDLYLYANFFIIL